MKNTLPHQNAHNPLGFSLVELLVVIAVIGLIAAIAIPQITKLTKKAEVASDQRNAQNIVSVYGASLAAGASYTSTALSGVINELETGVPGTGTFADSVFKISVIDDSVVQPRVEGYITFTPGTPADLTYNPYP